MNEEKEEANGSVAVGRVVVLRGVAVVVGGVVAGAIPSRGISYYT